MLMSFTLSMPGVKSWNGRWSGEGRSYVRVKSLRKPTFKPGYYTYCFSDGWMAGVDVAEIDAVKARKLRKSSAGFCGYDWMINSLLEDGRIVTPEQRRKEQEAQCPPA